LLSSQIIQFNEISCQYPKAYREASHCHRFLDSQMKDLDLLRILPAY